MHASLILARLTWLRLRRGRSLIVVALLMALTPLMAVLGAPLDITLAFLLRLPLVIATATLLSGAVAEELELKTHSYLFTRPIPRWSLLTGKLLATAPVLIVGFSLSAVVAWLLRGASGDELPTLARSFLGVVGAVVLCGALSVGAGTLFSKRPLVFVLGYLLTVNQLLQFVPLLQKLAISYYAYGLAELVPRHAGNAPFALVAEPVEAVVGTLVLSAAWLAVGVWRISRAEYAARDE
jgi:ABC-type transport system involved in multi-copper enzyme maturation permease subunit